MPIVQLRRLRLQEMEHPSPCSLESPGVSVHCYHVACCLPPAPKLSRLRADIHLSHSVPASPSC